MEKRLFIFLFFTGFISLVPSVPRKYYLIQQAKSWNDAQIYCRASHGDLAVIQSDDDMVEIQNEMQTQNFASSAWIGLYKHFYWSIGNEPVGTETHWGSNQPNNQNGNEACGAMYPSGWYDRTCTKKYPSVCYDDTKVGDQRYIYITTTMTWHEAQSYCRTNYTDLASARTETEISAIQGFVSGYTWIGLNREYWKWIDHTNFSHISWMIGNPDIVNGDPICGYLNNTEVADTRCSDILPFLCYSGKQQIVRMDVRSHNDPNDPAVMDAILEKVKNKLREHGLAEVINVKWKVQPDGNVFHKKTKK